MMLTDSDKDFFDAAADERIQYHYEQYRQRTQDSWERLLQLEKPYQEVLSRLSPDDSCAVREFHEHTFHMGADVEMMLYKCGVLDGLRLTNLLSEISSKTSSNT